MQIHAAVSFAGDGRAYDVADGQGREPLPLALAHRGEGVGRLSRLGDREHHGAVVERWIAITQLAGVLDLSGDAGELFQQVFPDQTGVPAGTARGEHDAVDAAELREGEVETAELRGGFVVIQPPAHRVFNRLGLLEDLL